jgi:hypothetical protein
MSIPVYWESFLHVTVNHGKPLFIAKRGLNYVKYKNKIWLSSNYYEVSSLPNRPLTTGLKNKSKATFEIEQCWIFAVLWHPFWKWRPVEIFRCRESIQVIIIYSPRNLHVKHMFLFLFTVWVLFFKACLLHWKLHI